LLKVNCYESQVLKFVHMLLKEKFLLDSLERQLTKAAVIDGYRKAIKHVVRYHCKDRPIISD